MVERKVGDAKNVPELHAEQREAVQCQLFRNELIQTPGNTELAKTVFDRKLPAAGQAEQDLVVRVGDCGLCPPAQLRRSLIHQRNA